MTVKAYYSFETGKTYPNKGLARAAEARKAAQAQKEFTGRLEKLAAKFGKTLKKA